MAFLIGGLLAAFALIAVLRPFLKGLPVARRASSSRPDALGLEGPSGTGQRTRQHVYDDIKTLLLEHDLGRLEEKEYLDRLQGLRLEGAALVRDDEGLEQAMDLALEQEILAARERSGERHGTLCWSCGRPVDGEADVCPSCGSEKTHEAPEGV